MPIRKPLFVNDDEHNEEMQATDELELAGLSMSGDITLGGNEVTGLPSPPSTATSAASKAYVDGIAAGILMGHDTIADLIHFIDEGPGDGYATGATKTITGGLFPTLIEWKRADATLLVTKSIERSAGPATNLKPTPIEWTLYDDDGTTVLHTVSDAVTYSGVAEVSRIRTIT